MGAHALKLYSHFCLALLILFITYTSTQAKCSRSGSGLETADAAGIESVTARVWHLASMMLAVLTQRNEVIERGADDEDEGGWND